MGIQFWIIAGLIIGWLVGIVMGNSRGLLGQIILGTIGGLVGGSLAVILFVVSGMVNPVNFIAAMIAFTCAAILLVLKRVVAQPSGSSA